MIPAITCTILESFRQVIFVDTFRSALGEKLVTILESLSQFIFVDTFRSALGEKLVTVAVTPNGYADSPVGNRYSKHSNHIYVTSYGTYRMIKNYSTGSLHQNLATLFDLKFNLK